MRVAFFGGSFDPPHLGHLRIAQAAADRMRLDRVLLAPVGLQPLKHGVAGLPTSFADRRAMMRSLIEEAGDARLALSELDAPRADGRPNYTYDTLQELRASLAAQDELLLLTGADALETLPQWHRAWELVCGVDLIVATRPGYPLDKLQAELVFKQPTAWLEPEQTIAGVKRRVLVPQLGLPERTPVLRKGEVANFYFLEGLKEEAAATAIRGALSAGEAPNGLAPGVLAYIREHGLYR